MKLAGLILALSVAAGVVAGVSPATSARATEDPVGSEGATCALTPAVSAVILDGYFNGGAVWTRPAVMESGFVVADLVERGPESDFALYAWDGTKLADLVDDPDDPYDGYRSALYGRSDRLLYADGDPFNLYGPASLFDEAGVLITADVGFRWIVEVREDLMIVGVSDDLSIAPAYGLVTKSGASIREIGAEVDIVNPPRFVAGNIAYAINLPVEDSSHPRLRIEQLNGSLIADVEPPQAVTERMGFVGVEFWQVVGENIWVGWGDSATSDDETEEPIWIYDSDGELVRSIPYKLYPSAPNWTSGLDEPAPPGTDFALSRRSIADGYNSKPGGYYISRHDGSALRQYFPAETGTYRDEYDIVLAGEHIWMKPRFVEAGRDDYVVLDLDGNETATIPTVIGDEAVVAGQAVAVSDILERTATATRLYTHEGEFLGDLPRLYTEDNLTNHDWLWFEYYDRDLDRSELHGVDLGGCAGQIVASWTPPLLDIDDSVFEADIEWLAAEGITRGCNPPDNTLFCPGASVTRGQMAAFLHRALGESITPSGEPINFSDTVGTTFAADIEWLSAAGITAGCNPPTNDQFCPDAPVTRGQMAAFLVRALGYSDNGGGNLFTDDDGSIFEGQIDRLATAGVTRGCNPPVNDNFCPNSKVTRGQMAAFLHRALGS